jgi:hypothetical protein
MIKLFQDWRVKLTRVVEFSEAALTSVGEQLIAQQQQGVLPKMTAIGEGMWQKTFLDSVKRVRPGKLHIPVLSTELGYGLIILDAAKLRELQQEKQPHVITSEDVKGQFMPLASCSIAQKAFVALHGLDLLAKLEQFRNPEPK